LHVRTIGTAGHEGLGDHVRAKLGRKLGKFATSIERVSVRFEDINGPRGGVDTRSRIKVVMSDVPTVVVESLGMDAQHAFDTASSTAERAVRKSLGRAGVSRGRMAGKATRKKAPKRRVNPAPAAGALVGRRVGRSAENLAEVKARPDKARRDAFVDTAAKGVSATDRKAGGGSTARRNVGRGQRATATLEDSATGKPSRKSTRRGANRAKSGSKQGRAAARKTRSPKRKATKAQAARR
jgi:hypothetical protein